MRRYTIYNRLTAVAAGLCLCWLFMACGEDRGGDLPDDDPNHCVVTITLRTSRSVRPPQTKAGGMMTKADETTETDFWAKDEEYERDITNWLVVAYDENADFAGYISGKIRILIIGHHQPVRDVSLVFFIFCPEIRLSSFIRLRHHPSGLRLRRAYRTGCPQSDSYNTMVRVVIREIAPPVFTTSHKKPTEAKTSGDRRQSVIYGIASHH